MANTGASLMLAGELVKQKTNIPYTWVPYKGASQAAVAVVSGEVDAMITDTGTSLQLIRAGRLQPIMIISEARSLQLPDVPTSGELGLDLKAESWFGVFAASKTPKAAVDRLNSAVNEVLARPEVIAKLQALDFRPVARTPADFTTFYRSELKRWAAIVKNGNIKLD